ncbi:MAG: carbon-nitrogen hydrolase family protein [Alphaproteobacteria bacterium]
MSGRTINAALIQMCAGEDPEANIDWLSRRIADAAGQGADLVVTPENSHAMVSGQAAREAAAMSDNHDARLAPLYQAAKRAGLMLCIGSITVKTAKGLANRCLLIGPDGALLSSYDKIHLFDVDLPGGESYRESDSMVAGERAVTADIQSPSARLGLSICYDLRFANLYRMLAQSGAEIITVPAAFTVPTGQAHWETLLRARAIETGAFILAPAQTGQHACGRATWGHSLAISPWGEVLADGGTDEGVTLVSLKLDKVAKARASIPQLQHGRDFSTD